MKEEFWRGKRVLITGHNGYKGTWLSKWLDRMGAEVMGISLHPDKENRHCEVTFSDQFSEKEIDLRNFEELQCIRDFKPEIVFHLAAQAIVKSAKEKPLETFSTNVMGTANVLEVLRTDEELKSVVVITSDKVYENTENGNKFVETDKLMGDEPYSCSKVAEEQVARAYFMSYYKGRKIGFATARACNTFGGCDFHFDRLIPYLEECSCNGVVPVIRNPQAVRPWQYVLDVLAGYIDLAEKLYGVEQNEMKSYNFGPAEREMYTVGEMAGIVCGRKVGSNEKQAFSEAGLLMLNSEKAEKELDWKRKFSLAEGLLETNKAYQMFFDKENINDIYEKMLDRYNQHV